MKNGFKTILWIFVAIVSFASCAKKGRPTGGPRDTLAPVILKSVPENYTTQFKGNEIRIYFDEYIKLKDLQQNLIVSPPLSFPSIITPTSSSKMLKLRIQDTLKENTTYVFNFGNSIVDNNEDNEFEYYNYVLSTGTYIDSLKVSGTVNESTLPALSKKTTIMLYGVQEAFNDSIIYKEKPSYITTTKEENPTFELANVKEGTYLLVALQEELSNYTFEPQKDKIAFFNRYISLPTDTTFSLILFKEIPAYKVTRPSQISKNKIAFGFEGEIDSLTITPDFEIPEGYEYLWQKDTKKDSLNYWFQPAFDIEKTDTLRFIAKNGAKIDTLNVKLRDLYADSLQVNLMHKNTITIRDSIKLQTNTPIVSFDAEKVEIIDKDSLVIKTTSFIDFDKNEVALVFDKTEEQSYKIKILPDAFLDFFKNTNDTLKYNLRTKAASDYGTVRFTLENVKTYPLLVELVDEKFNTIASSYLKEKQEVFFDFLDPNKYYLRVTYDANQNKRWDTGNFLQKLQPEEIIYYPAQIEVRANWDVVEVISLE